MNLGINFSVIIAPIELRGNFSMVSGLTQEIEYDVYNEGGNFTDPIMLPKGMKYSNIVLQRGTVSMEPLVKWYETVKSGVYLKYPMLVTMMDDKRRPVKIWTVLDTIPVNVEYTPMNAMGDSIAVTTVELVHGSVIDIT